MRFGGVGLVHVAHGDNVAEAFGVPSIPAALAAAAHERDAGTLVRSGALDSGRGERPFPVAKVAAAAFSPSGDVLAVARPGIAPARAMHLLARAPFKGQR